MPTVSLARFIFVCLHALLYSDDVDGDIKALLGPSSADSGSTTVGEAEEHRAAISLFPFPRSISHFLFLHSLFYLGERERAYLVVLLGLPSRFGVLYV